MKPFLTDDPDIYIHAEDWDTAEELAKALDVKVLGELIETVIIDIGDADDTKP